MTEREEFDAWRKTMADGYNAWDAWQEAVRRERKQLALPKSYGGSTLGSWADQKEGCTLRIHFTDAKEAAEWFDRLMDGWVRSRSEQVATSGPR